MPRHISITFLLFLLPVGALGQSGPQPGDVVINEVMYAPSPSENEFIELYNRSSEAVQLNRLQYADENRDFSPVTSTDSLLPPDEYAVLVRDSSAFATAFPSTNVLVPTGWDALNNGGDTVVLRDEPSGTVIDRVPYDPSWGGSDGNALERIDPAAPSDRAENFGTSDADAGATPGAQNSIFDPDEKPPELFRVRPTVDGDSLLARFSEPLDSSTVSATAFSLAPNGTPTIETATVSDTAAALVVCTLSQSPSTGEFTLVATDVADPAGNVRDETQSSFRFFVPERPAPEDVVVTEILYAPSPAENEFIEIYNRSEKTVDLGTLQYADENRDFDRLAPRLTALKPDSHAVIVRDAAAFEAAFPNTTFRAPAGWDALNNGGDTVVLRHEPSATVIDEVPYEANWGGTDGRSLERIDPAGPSDAASNFAPSDAEAGATPGDRNSRFDPDETPPRPVFAEQTAQQQAVVTFSEPLEPGSVTPAAFTLSETTVTDAVLSPDTVVTLSLTSPPSGATVDVNGVRDRVGNVLSSTRIPLALRPGDGEIIVNEILFAPRADDYDERPNQVEYVELLNRTDQPLTLRGLFVTDRPTERGVADTVRAGRRTILASGGYGVVAAAPTGAHRADSSQLADAFPETPLSADSVAFLPVDAQGLGLTNSGDLVRLHRADGTAIAEVAYTPEWHAPGLEQTKGTALERISPSGRPNAAGNWTSSTDPTGGTPGRKNAASLTPPEEAPDVGLEIAPSPFSVERDGATRIQYTLDEVPNLVRARIFDARGRKVRTLEDARLVGRSGELVWKGRDDAGNQVRIGVYVVHFEAVQTDAGTIATFKEPVVVGRPLN